MTAVQRDIVIEQGATFTLPLVWKVKATGLPIDITGYTARMHVRETHESSDTLIELSSPSDGITLGGANGTIDVLIDASETAALTPGTGVYDLELVNGSVVHRIIEGAVVITPEVTR
jgi:hypothetical protein